MEFNNLMELALKFRDSKCFLVSLELGVFDFLCTGEKTASEVARGLSLDARATGILLDALVTLKLLVKQDGHYSNVETAEQFLVKNNADYRGAIFKHLHACWGAWTDFENTVKSGRPAAELLAYKSSDANDDFIWGMDNVGKSRALNVLEVMGFSGFNSMLDLGCGAATYSIAFAKSNPKLKVTSLDLDISLRVARKNVSLNKLDQRFSFIGGDFLTVDWGSGYDLIWASQFIHCFGDEDTRWLIKKAYDLLPKSGKLMIHDFLLDEDKTGPAYGAIFSAHMLAATRNGRSYSVPELTAWMTEAGFNSTELVKVNETSSVLIGEK